MADLRRKAKRALLEGKYKQALGYFEELHKADPDDIRTHLKLAELREKTGDTKNAIKDYMAIANAYAEEGFVVQAIAINKIILRLDPSRTEVQERLKQLSEERGDDWAVSTIISASEELGSEAAGKERPKINVERTPLLSSLSGEELETFIDSLRLEHVDAKKYIYKEGDPGEHLYLIGMGSVRLEVKDEHGRKRVFSVLSEGDFFGEYAFMSRTPRTESAVAESDCDLLIIDRATFDYWVEKYPSIQSTVEDFYRQRVLARVLAIAPVFEGVPPEARNALVDRFQLKRFSDGQVIVREGELGDTFYLIRSGRVRVFTQDLKGKGGDIVELSGMGPGDFFGEVALLTDKPRTATVVADGDVELMELTRDAFNEIVAAYPSVKKVVQEYQKKRVQDTIRTLMRRKKR